jgi:hypothetical protein
MIREHGQILHEHAEELRQDITNTEDLRQVDRTALRIG